MMLTLTRICIMSGLARAANAAVADFITLACLAICFFYLKLDNKGAVQSFRFRTHQPLNAYSTQAKVGFNPGFQSCTQALHDETVFAFRITVLTRSYNCFYDTDVCFVIKLFNIHLKRSYD